MNSNIDGIPDELWSRLKQANEKTHSSFFKYKNSFYHVERRLYPDGYKWDIKEIKFEELADEPK